MHSESTDATPAARTAPPTKGQPPEPDGDLLRLSVSLSIAHTPDVASAAALVALTRTVFAALPESGQPAVVKLLQLQMQCISEWLERRGIDSRDLDAALLGIQQAAETLAYIDALPD